MFEYEIYPVQNESLFYKLCAEVEKQIPNLRKEELYIGAEGTRIQIYHHPEGCIDVRNDTVFNALYILSDFEISPYFQVNPATQSEQAHKNLE